MLFNFLSQFFNKESGLAPAAPPSPEASPPAHIQYTRIETGITSTVPDTNFSKYLDTMFSRAPEIFKVFQDLGLDPPRNADEYLIGLEGAIIFLDEYKMVLRIEHAQDTQGFDGIRVNDHPRILQPIATISVGETVIELCPGVHQAKTLKEEKELIQALEQDRMYFWDAKLSNMGRLPFKTPSFPDGIPVVIDRLAVSRLTSSVSIVRDALAKKRKQEVKDAQDQLFTPLRQTFREAWPDPSLPPNPEKIQDFWALCHRFAIEGKLVAGWEEPQSPEARNEHCKWGNNNKTRDAARKAGAYQKRAYYKDSTPP